MTSWSVLKCSLSELNLDFTLSCGQSFRWKKNDKLGHWNSVICNMVFSLKQDLSGNLLYRVFDSNSKNEDYLKENTQLKIRSSKKLERFNPLGEKTHKNKEVEDCQSFSKKEQYEKILHNYFQLDINLTELYNKWSKMDTNFCEVAQRFPGIRMLRQDPVENVFSFICSANNNISRISSMVEKLCSNYGDLVGELEGTSYYSFPAVRALATEGVEVKLRELGFGYRAKYIAESAKMLTLNHPSDWLESLRASSYEDAKSELLKLTGVGAKVADCICLMSLDKAGAIPVDTHVWQIACRDYMPHLKKHKSVNATVYKEIGDFFRNRFGDYAGWAHSVLFCSDLKKFK